MTGVGKSRGGGNRIKLNRGPATAEKSGMYHGIKVPLDAFEKPFAGGSALDALPGRLESMIFPQRYGELFLHRTVAVLKYVGLTPRGPTKIDGVALSERSFLC